MTTTLNKIKEHSPCKEGWETLLRSLGKTKADDEPLKISHIVESNGVQDATWCLRAVEGHDREIRLFAVWCARQVQHLMTDKRSLEALAVAERFADGAATEAELYDAQAAAQAAVRDAAQAAVRDAAWSAADAAWSAARSAARSAADAAWSAARSAARSAADAAWDAAWDAQKRKLLEICEEAVRA